jgi:pSer/pThr/pTyr-binding forkhead associated (FHA) protein
MLSASAWESRLQRGTYLIGRDPACRILIDDPIASREHARLIVATERVTLKDLDSSNGCYVNNERVTKSRVLHQGDRLLIGRTEIVVAETTFTESSMPREERPTLTGAPSGDPAVATVRAGALEVLGQVADRFLAAGQAGKAKEVLADSLVKVLDGVRSGIRVPDALIVLASRYALKLAGGLGDGAWIDFVMELHLRAQRAMAPDTLADLQLAIETVRCIDHELYRGYLDWLEGTAPQLSGRAPMVAQQLARIRLPLPRGRR